MASGATSTFFVPVTQTGTASRRAPLGSSAILALLLTFAGYYAGSQIGFALTFQPHPVSVLWPPNSILLAALLLTPRSAWGIVLLGAFPAHCLVQWQSDIPLPMMLCYFVSNSCEALIGAGCIRYFIPGQMRFDSLRSTTIFCLAGGLLGPFLSSFLDAGFVRLNHWGVGQYWEIWTSRFFSNVLTALTFAPAIVMWFVSWRSWRRPWKRTVCGEMALLFFGLVVVSYGALYREGPSADPVLFLVPLPFLFWASLRLGPRGTTTAILIVVFLAIWSAAHGHGPFTAETPEQNARALQLFLIVMTIPFLFLAAGIEERGAAEERFAKAFSSSPDAMSIIRLSDGTLLDVNERWLGMFGYGRAEVIGRRVADLKTESSSRNRTKLIALSEDGGASRDVESPVQDRNGNILYVQSSAQRVELRGEPCLISIARDVTDRKHAEEADRNLAHATRLAVLGEMTASIAHEINQPLGAILSNADALEMLLENDSPPLEELRKIVTDIRNDNVRASETIRHIRTLTAKRNLQLETVDLHDVILQVTRLMSSEARRRQISIRTTLTAAAPKISGDRIHLQQVLINLIVNGMEAMSVTREPDRRLIIGTAGKGDEQVEISVTDFGCGIPSEKLPRLFESFFTTKENGVGLGLAIVRSIVQAHGGAIGAENNAKDGMSFRLILPLLKVNGAARL